MPRKNKKEFINFSKRVEPFQPWRATTTEIWRLFRVFSKAEQISVGEGNLFDNRQIIDEEKS